MEVDGRMVFVRPSASAETLAERLRSAGTSGVVLTAPPNSGFAALREIPTHLPPASRTAESWRVLRFWVSARTAVLRHRAVRWAEVDGYLAEQACRHRMSTGGLIETLFDRLV